MPVVVAVAALASIRLRESLADFTVPVGPYRSSYLAPCHCPPAAINSIDFSVAVAVQAFALGTD